MAAGRPATLVRVPSILYLFHFSKCIRSKRTMGRRYNNSRGRRANRKDRYKFPRTSNVTRRRFRNVRHFGQDTFRQSFREFLRRRLPRREDQVNRQGRFSSHLRVVQRLPGQRMRPNGRTSSNTGGHTNDHRDILTVRRENRGVSRYAAHRRNRRSRTRRLRCNRQDRRFPAVRRSVDFNRRRHSRARSRTGGRQARSVNYHRFTQASQ